MVLEKNELAQSVLNKEIENYNNNIKDVSEEEPIFFITVDEQPLPIGRLETIDRKIIYPGLAIINGIEGKVYIKTFVDIEGNVEKTEVLKGINEECDRSAQIAIALTKFIPGKRRGIPIKCAVTVSIRFLLNDSVSSKISFEGKDFYLDKSVNVFKEKGFNYKKSEKVKYLSKKFFDYMYKYPYLIKYVLFWPSIGLKIPEQNKWLLIEVN